MNFKQQLVNHIFSTVAQKYDFMNDIMSLGIHRLWKNSVCNEIKNLNSNIIDVATGTGDIILRIKSKAIKYNKYPNIFALDINEKMLDICRNKLIDHNLFQDVNLIVANALNIPIKSNYFDYYIIGFGIRNIKELDQCLLEAHRVLKPNGKFICIEFSKIDNDLINYLYKSYSFNIIPKLGSIFASSKNAYEYLVNSIDSFLEPEALQHQIYKAGFNNVKYKKLSLGIATIHTAYKLW